MDITKVNSIYCGVDLEPAMQGDVARWLRERLGAPGGGTPEAAPQDEAANSDDRNIPPLPRRGKRCSSARIQAAGYVFIHPTFREGYGAMLAGTSPPGEAV